MSSRNLIYHQKRHHLELKGVTLHGGEWIEICVLGSWLAGKLNKDHTGWYLTTSNQVGIRLQSGLVARFRKESSPLPVLANEPLHDQEPSQGEEARLLLLADNDEGLSICLYSPVQPSACLVDEQKAQFFQPSPLLDQGFV